MATYRMNRRTLLRTSALGAGAVALATNRPTRTSAQDKTTLRVYWNAGHNYETYQEVVAQFEADNPGVEVNFELFQWPDMRTKILADFAAGSVPDLCEEPGGWVQEFGLAGNIQSLQPYIDADGEAMGFPSDWQPYTVDRNSLDGEVYGVQLHLTCALLFYNQDMFDAAGITAPPTNWEEFLATAQETAKDGVFGFAPNQRTEYTWFFLLQNGVRFYDPETNTIPMDNEAAYEAMRFQADLIHEYNVSPVPIASADYEGPQKLFSAKRTAMIVTGPWDIKPIQDGSPDINWGIAQALTQKEQSTFAAGTSMMIPTEAENPDLAWDLMKRLVALDIEVAATKEASMAMPRKSWGEQPEIQEMERIDPFAQGLNYAVDVGGELRLTGKSGEIEELFGLTYEQVIYRNTPPEEALGDFVEKANEALQR